MLHFRFFCVVIRDFICICWSHTHTLKIRENQNQDTHTHRHTIFMFTSYSLIMFDFCSLFFLLLLFFVSFLPSARDVYLHRYIWRKQWIVRHQQRPFGVLHRHEMIINIWAPMMVSAKAYFIQLVAPNCTEVTER